ncbi:MAG: NAD(P)/FAD-dependent oxidoreductase [Mycobacteriaceae bacterium]
MAIVGTGIAGVTAAETLRAQGFDGNVVLVGEEQALPYRRPTLSKDLLSGTMAEAKASLKSVEYWADKQIDLRLGVKVLSLDAEGKVLKLSDGSEIAYDALLLATGGTARGIEHQAGDRVFTLRQLSDTAPLREALLKAGSVLIIGAGLIGAEVAATARALGVEVTLIEAAATPLSRIMPTEVSALFEQIHQENGVSLHTNASLSELISTDTGVRAIAADGRSWEAPIAVIAIGMVPDTELAQRAGLAIDQQYGGIVTDEFLETSVSGIFAAGDVASYPNSILGDRYRGEHWNSAQAQGASAAASMLGNRLAFTEVPWSWSSQYGLNIQVAGWPRSTDDTIVRGAIADRNFTVLCRREGRLVAAVTMGRPKDTRAARELISNYPEAPVELLADSGTALAEITVQSSVTSTSSE